MLAIFFGDQVIATVATGRRFDHHGPGCIDGANVLLVIVDAVNLVAIVGALRVAPIYINYDKINIASQGKANVGGIGAGYIVDHRGPVDDGGLLVMVVGNLDGKALLDDTFDEIKSLGGIHLSLSPLASRLSPIACACLLFHKTWNELE